MLRLREFNDLRLNELLEVACSKESIYWIERKIYPDMDGFVKAKERDEMAAFLLRVCDRDDMMLSIETFSLCLSLLDRFLSAFKVKSKYLECLAVACLYVASKVKEEDEKISITSEFLQDCMCQCSVSELLRMENMLLNKFEWSVNDVTTIDFVYLYYALFLNKFKENDLINKLNETEMNCNGKEAESTASCTNSSVTPKPKWKKIKTTARRLDEKHLKLYGYCPPLELDFLHTIETKLKHCLCVDELVRAYRPRVLAYALIETEVDKLIGHKQTNSASKQAINEIKNYIMASSSLNGEQVEQCKETISLHMDALEASGSFLIDQECLDQCYIEMARHKMNMMQPLSAISTHLSVIEEEEEELAAATANTSATVTAAAIATFIIYESKEQIDYNNNNSTHRREKNLSDLKKDLIVEIEISDTQSSTSETDNPNVLEHKVLGAISNNIQLSNSLKISSNEKHSNNYKCPESKEAVLTYPKESHFSKTTASFIASLTYADILIGRREQKRKLSENSSNDEEFECENENRPL
jgi:hypothetical protein